jgi:hypothetical protein
MIDIPIIVRAQKLLQRHEAIKQREATNACDSEKLSGCPTATLHSIPSEMKTLTEKFVELVLDIRYDALPPQAIDIAKQVTLDGLAVTLAGATEPLGVGRISTEYVNRWAGRRRRASSRRLQDVDA